MRNKFSIHEKLLQCHNDEKIYENKKRNNIHLSIILICVLIVCDSLV